MRRMRTASELVVRQSAAVSNEGGDSEAEDHPSSSPWGGHVRGAAGAHATLDMEEERELVEPNA